MRPPVLKLVMALLLALAVPLQGFAAASGAFCLAPEHPDHRDCDTPGKTHSAPCAAGCATAISTYAVLPLAAEGSDAVYIGAARSHNGVSPAPLDRPPPAA